LEYHTTDGALLRLNCPVFAPQSIVNAVKPGWSTTGGTVEWYESVESNHDLSEAHIFCFWVVPFFIPNLSANLAWHRRDGLPRPETSDYLSINAVEGIKDIAANYFHGLNIRTVERLT
jgi:hypothetical protein